MRCLAPTCTPDKAGCGARLPFSLPQNGSGFMVPLRFEIEPTTDTSVGVRLATRGSMVTHVKDKVSLHGRVPIKHTSGNDTEVNDLAFCIECEITREDRYRERMRVAEALDYQQSLAHGWCPAPALFAFWPVLLAARLAKFPVWQEAVPGLCFVAVYNRAMNGITIYVDWAYFLGIVGTLIGIAYYANGRFTKIETTIEWLKETLIEIKSRLEDGTGPSQANPHFRDSSPLVPRKRHSRR
jgi:hypothetical protein